MCALQSICFSDNAPYCFIALGNLRDFVRIADLLLCFEFLWLETDCVEQWNQKKIVLKCWRKSIKKKKVVKKSKYCRKNIRKIMKNSDLCELTKVALKNELKRKQQVKEKEKKVKHEEMQDKWAWISVTGFFLVPWNFSNWWVYTWFWWRICGAIGDHRRKFDGIVATTPKRRRAVYVECLLSIMRKHSEFSRWWLHSSLLHGPW